MHSDFESDYRPAERLTKTMHQALQAHFPNEILDLERAQENSGVSIFTRHIEITFADRIETHRIMFNGNHAAGTLDVIETELYKTEQRTTPVGKLLDSEWDEFGLYDNTNKF